MAVLEHWLVNPYRPPKSIAATLALFGNLLNGTHGPTLFSSANFLTSKSPAPFATISKEFFGLLQIFLNYFLWPSCLDGIVPLFQRQKGCAPWTSRLTPHHMVSTHSESKCLISGEHRLTKRQLGPSYPVFDLPQLYTKPSAADILKALELLAVQPRTFNHDEKLEVQHHIHASGISQYLTSIIASALAWVDSDELREQIWEAASARLCERSGRSGKTLHHGGFWDRTAN